MSAVGKGRRLAPPRSSVATRIEIRRATLADAKTVAKLRASLVRFEAELDDTVVVKRDADAILLRDTMRRLRQPSDATFLAWDGRVAVGVIRVSAYVVKSVTSRGAFGLVTSAYVRPAFRRRGVLRRLVNAAEEWSLAYGLPELRLHCAVPNAVGNRAWEALGFAPLEMVRIRPVRTAGDA